jgi:hypothetical protein
MARHAAHALKKLAARGRAKGLFTAGVAWVPMGMREAAVLAVAGGAMLLLANLAQGSLSLSLFQVARADLTNDAAAFLPANVMWVVPTLLELSVVLQTVGGAIVILGGWAYLRHHRRTGNLLLNIGGGTGIGGLVLLGGVAAAGNQLGELAAWLAGPAGLAVLLTFAAGYESKRHKKSVAHADELPREPPAAWTPGPPTPARARVPQRSLGDRARKPPR